MRRVWGLVTVVGAAVILLAWNARTGEEGRRPPSMEESAWSRLDPEHRCAEAAVLVTSPRRWRMVCRWRNPGETLQGQAFPPPVGPPPFDDPHIEIYVAPGQSREDVSRAIAHEFGHMQLTRDPAFIPQWLAARNLPPDTRSEVWTEDFAEVFAALFSPPADHWRAPTPRPSADALVALKGAFFS